ncbi:MULTISPECIES: alpha/beta hydrolase family protein [unclassified Corynebacterium]|uniref:alpha/beta hydrolase family protein n=1 Tax=unclassified Corynebacterium TaxID=2624378 RepID=UPI0029CA2E5A|nr:MULTISPECIES: YqiA/YcfP family alpha/beta fold hydrolase [unclassified Corynebacterium]WPF67144.1 YqiA/YcfP family alpha/beta fold hydrolase [Corynebacterium sp. 22KM0430]WPF69632.1 YqiA/YcfP family alpha/beta fold hydrolase [Corynebacterium sp. 21KM1197]
MRSHHVALPFAKGTLDAPEHPRAYALIAHCFAGSRHNLATARISKRLAHHGIATLRFDFPTLMLGDHIEHLRLAHAWLSQHYQAPSLLIGHSLGGAAVLRAAIDAPSVTIGSPHDPHRSILPYVQGSSATIAGHTVELPEGFLADLSAHSPHTPPSAPLLVLHAPEDEVVPVTEAEDIFHHAAYPKSLLSLAGSNHMLTTPGATQRAADLIHAWFESISGSCAGDLIK